MFSHRYGGDRPRVSGATAGDVFVAVSKDADARGLLGEVYRKLFEGQGVRQGSSPDHFVYVSPGRARREIDDLGGWIAERFGEPGSTVPARTPFGYLSGKRDGWVTYFAALSFGNDRSLSEDFAESVARMSWSAYASGRGVSGGAGAQAPPAPAASSWREKFGLSKTAPAPAPAPAPAEKPGIVERFFGTPGKLPPEEEEEKEMSAEEEEAAEAAYRARVDRVATEEFLRKFRAERDVRLQKERPAPAPQAPLRRLVKDEDEDETERARVRAALARQQEEKAASIRRHLEVEREAKLSTVEKLKRPGGPAF